VEYNILYHNNGNGTFHRRYPASSGLRGRGWAGGRRRLRLRRRRFSSMCSCRACSAAVSSIGTAVTATFIDVTAETLRRTPHGAIGAKVFDYDGDGRLDLFVVDMHSDMWMGLDSRHSSLETAKAGRASPLSSRRPVRP